MNKTKYLGWAVGLSLLLSLATPVLASPVPPQIGPGAVIRGTSWPNLYYLGRDNRLYNFTDNTVFLSWYPDFSNVVQVSDAQIAAYQSAFRTVTYKPGFRIIKIASDPQLYAVDRMSAIRPISSSVAAVIYGAGWLSHVVTVSDVAFSYYRLSTPVTGPADFDVYNVLHSIRSIDDNLGI